jgi:predicted lipid-binding transport protein (Tim44 family)
MIPILRNASSGQVDDGDGTEDRRFREAWAMARAESF